MIARVAKAGIAAAALVAMPGMAIAGTSTATGAANFSVISQCSVAGNTVNVGTYTTSQTWNDVANELGKWVTSYTSGTKGGEYLTWGSVTCDNGVPYTLAIRGSSVHVQVPSGLQFTQNGKIIRMGLYVKKVGNTVIPDFYPGSGRPMGDGRNVGSTGTGAPQQVLGSVTFNANASDALLTDTLAVPGAVSDTLTYTLNF